MGLEAICVAAKKRVKAPKNPTLVMVRSISEEDEQLKEKLRVIAFEQRIDVSDIVRDSLWRYVREYESARKGASKDEA